MPQEDRQVLGSASQVLDSDHEDDNTFSVKKPVFQKNLQRY